jgi:hypothetical protein
VDEAGLLKLIEKWERIASKKFADADADKKQRDEFGYRFISHGAMCYYNCATELREFLASTSPLSSAIPQAEKK